MTLIEQAGREGVQILCLQEIFNGPYFCAEQSTRWYDAVETIPDGPTDEADAGGREEARHGDRRADLRGRDDRRLLQHRRRHRRRRHVPRQVPQEPHPARARPGFWEKFYFRPGNLGYPVFETRVREGRRLHLLRPPLPRRRARARAERRGDRVQSVGDRRGTVASTCGSSSSRRTPSRTATSSARSTASGYEAPWNIGEFYGQSYFCDPRGQIIAQASRDKDELVVADLDLDMIREVRNTWQFYRDRRPETYGGLVKL